MQSEGARHIESCDPMTEFHCSNGNCLPLSWACNGQKDCFDGSDESPSNCPECRLIFKYSHLVYPNILP